MKKIYILYLSVFTLFLNACQEIDNQQNIDYNETIRQTLKIAVNTAQEKYIQAIKKNDLNFNELLINDNLTKIDTNITEYECFLKIMQNSYEELYNLFVKETQKFMVQNSYSLIKGDNFILPNAGIDSMAIVHYFELTSRQKIINKFYPIINIKLTKIQCTNLNNEQVANSIATFSVDLFFYFMKQSEKDIRKNPQKYTEQIKYALN